MDSSGAGVALRDPGRTEQDTGRGARETIDRVGSEHYDRPGYFDGSAHLTNPDSAFHRYRIREVLRLAAPRSDDRVADLGCGWGTISFAIARHVREVVGIDFSRAAIDICRRKGLENGDGAIAGRARLLRADAADTGLGPRSFD